MKSRLFRTVLTLVAPLVIEFLIKKFTGKKEVKDVNKQMPSPH
ncbi:hypothetical protein CHRY9390_00243 [Chryseobacterium aquaeductus]|uniref:Uncharacterized protein n=1 Tax=Chryseobacterium aquaeductus TaxID=2675056 RepID=A0A9N8MDM8_9FLAO|nr:hypothetical protein [Chryseobacterium aquaeductus]CAA7329604.1 hypothetical protein CHRY9390_00243 [Chryseobacterium potabilaquae]CAD7797880.1 hypothetical protein CHRY9390_00243 [Chryseobacterium aquaeductus]